VFHGGRVNCSEFSSFFVGVTTVAILNRFLRLLKLLEDLADFGEFLTTSTGTAFVFCLLSYQALALMGCDATAAAILASTAALTLHCTLNRPNF
jgi:hypothetical protein